MKVQIASSAAARLRGLAGRGASSEAIALVPCHDIHTFTMAHPIDVAFVSSAGLVLESHRAVPPMRRLRNRDAAMVLERFAQPGEWFAEGDQIELIAISPVKERKVST